MRAVAAACLLAGHASAFSLVKKDEPSHPCNADPEACSLCVKIPDEQHENEQAGKGVLKKIPGVISAEYLSHSAKGGKARYHVEFATPEATGNAIDHLIELDPAACRHPHGKHHAMSICGESGDEECTDTNKPELDCSYIGVSSCDAQYHHDAQDCHGTGVGEMQDDGFIPKCDDAEFGHKHDSDHIKTKKKEKEKRHAEWKE